MFDAFMLHVFSKKKIENRMFKKKKVNAYCSFKVVFIPNFVFISRKLKIETGSFIKHA